MRKIATIVCALALVFAGLTTASANTDQVTTDNCNHWTGGGVFPLSADHLVGPGGFDDGAVQLCKNGSDYWGYIVLKAPEPSGFWAQAGLYRIRNNVKVQHVNCDTPPIGSPNGGNRHVAPTETRCWTQKLRIEHPDDRFYVLGIDCLGTYPNCDDVWASGDTAVTR